VKAPEASRVCRQLGDIPAEPSRALANSSEPSPPLSGAERFKRAPPHGHAAAMLLGADRIAAEEAYTTFGEVEHSNATAYRERGLMPMSEDMVVVGVGGELVPTDCGEGAREWRLLNTLDNPTYVTADASRSRLDLAQQAGSLEGALDAAETIEARDSLERMLAHQLATAHTAAMKLSAEMNKQIDHALRTRGEGENERAILNATRLAGAVGRIMSSYQQGMLTVQRLRSGGKQVVTVQHVSINEGAQALVAGNMRAGGGGGRRGHGGGRTRK
jgi:hypothetical protein